MKPVGRKEGLSFVESGVERVVHDESTGAIHVLDEEASRLLDLMDGNRSLSELEEAFCAVSSAGTPGHEPEVFYDIVNGLVENRLVDPPEFSVATARLVEAVALAPQDEVPYIKLGVAYLLQGNRVLAAEQFSKAVALNPQSVDALLNQATVHFLEERFEEAEQDLQRVLAIDPKQAAALNNLGNVFSQKGEAAAAADLYRQALEVQADYVDPLSNLGHHYLESDPERARGFYERALALDPGHSSSLKSVLKILVDGGQYEQAITLFRAAIATEPKHPGCHDVLIGLFRMVGRHADAVNVYREVLASYPDADLSRFEGIQTMRAELGF